MMTDSPLRWSANRIYKATDKGSCNKTILTIINQDEVDDHIICPRVWVKDHSDISRNINRSQQINIEFARARSEFTDLELAEPVREGKKVELNGESRWTLLKKIGIGYLATEGVGALKEILQQANIYQDEQINLMIEAISDCEINRVVKRAFDNSHTGFINGQKITVHITKEPFGNFSLYLFGLVISRLLTELTAINSYTELEIVTTGQQQTILTYPAQMGQIKFI